ncbi:hypothetical protein [Phytohabitans houttuyneae]|uniref:BioF2-like acetyltransferase domain-containing protein n=1 Tax=Phytohabitans houttuyneae TaxID=1076126 RepID=A0A6V8K692_9ACTN|nr:hypothetical protein [Phytohabitans houttuyneae]GFJ77506.1 hypothetical protein Phou_016860 [Phytohabitans houttuyneae]
MPDLARMLRGRRSFAVAELAEPNRADLLPTWLQDDADVHGSHGLFYWLRARGRGLVVSAGDAATVLTWRPDVDRLVAVRPVGATAAVVTLLEEVGEVAAAAAPNRPFVARYCTPAVAAGLAELGWGPMAAPWHPAAPHDDETHPEVVVTAPVAEIPAGQRYKPIREAIFRHAARYTYLSSPVPLGLAEAAFVERGTARAGGYDGHERGFNTAVLASFAGRRHDWLTYHYLIRDGLAGLAVTGNVTGIAHGYYLATRNVPRLTTYLLWLIYLQQRRAGAAALNLGGSETRTLHAFKVRTFPGHDLQPTVALQRHLVPTSR